MTRDYRLQVRVSKEFYDKILLQAILMDVSVSFLTRMAVKTYLEELTRQKERKIVEVRR
jgi:hypothetical protein